MSTEPNKREGQERIAYNVIGPVIENKVRSNAGEDGLIVVDYAELRDALAELFLQHLASERQQWVEEIAKLPEELEPEYHSNNSDWQMGYDFAMDKLDAALRRSIQKGEDSE